MNNNSLDVIKYVGDNNVLVAKSHIENFNTKSQLIVNESQEALFYKDGQALDLFLSGRHSLNTDNLPFFKRLFGKIFNKQTPFDCEVFFINKVMALEIQWGTAEPFALDDPRVGMTINVRANGQTGIRVVDSRKFVVKVVGQLSEYTVDNVKRAIKGAMMMCVKDCIARTIINNNVSILEISAKLREVSEMIRLELNKDLEDLGLEAVHFYANNIAANPEDLKVYRELQIEWARGQQKAKLRAIEGQGEAAFRQAQGYTYQDQMNAEILKAAASNQGMAGATMGAGMGVGLGFGFGQQMGNTMGQQFGQQPQSQQAPQQNMIQCSECGGQVVAGAKFCPNCGKPIVPKKKFCMNCGNELASDAKFCPNCGSKQ